MFTRDKMKILPLNTDNSLEKGVKNKWRWECLEEKDVEGERVGGKKQQNTLAVSFCEPCGKTRLTMEVERLSEFTPKTPVIK